MGNFIIEKYKEYEIKEIQSGYRCKTFLLTKENSKLIYQVYLGNTKYQAKKKVYITNLIKNNIEVNEIPNIIDYSENKEFAYLVTEYKEGMELNDIDEKIFNSKVFYENLANILLKIHSVNVGNKFGWIGEDGLEEKKYFYEYMEYEITRNLKRIEENCNDKEIVSEIKNKAENTLERIKKFKDLKPAILWYDINEKNLIINNDSQIIGFIDAGGARFGPKEWDIAFIKMDLCRNKKEFEIFEKKYLKESKIDEELLGLLDVIVEIDDIAFQLSSLDKLPIAYDSCFRDVIEKIQKEIL